MPLHPSLYGFLISVAILVCLWLAEKKAKADGKPATKVWDIGITTILCGLVGARFYHIVDLWAYYSQQPLKILYFWQGGIAVWGAIIGGTVGILVYLKLTQEPNKLYWLDLFSLFMPLGQAIGRWGNFFNQENFGTPTNLPWGISIAPQLRPNGLENVTKFHPLFLYESLLNLVLYAALLKINKKLQLGSGRIFAFYIVGYSTIRFFLEYLKMTPWNIGGINVAQTICIVAGISAFIFLKKHSNIG